MEVHYIVFAVPVFFLLIGIELAWGFRHGHNTYRVADTLASLGAGVLSQATGLLTRGLLVLLYAWTFEHVSLTTLPSDSAWVWLFAVLGYDLCYYWFHRLSHERAILWAAHVVHHQSEDYNLGTALRQSSTTFLLGWIFYLPLAITGVPPLVFAVAAGINLLYQFWVHTEHVPKLGWLDRVFVTASNHRVHHARNDRYLDRNYGGIFILWDRFFGTFAEEADEEPVRFGIRKPFRSFNAVRANLEPYGELLADARATARPTDRWRVWFSRTGWRPADLPPFDAPPLEAPKFETDPPGWLEDYAMVQFGIVVAATLWLMIAVSGLAIGSVIAGVAVITLALWSIGELMARGEAARGFEAGRWLLSVATFAGLGVAGEVGLAAAGTVVVLATLSLAWLRARLAFRTRATPQHGTAG